MMTYDKPVAPEHVKAPEPDCPHPWAHQDANGYPTCAACGTDWTNVMHPPQPAEPPPMNPLERLLPGETRSEYLDRLERSEQRVAHSVIARLFELPIKDMGGGLRIVSLGKSWLPVEERDLIVRAVREFADRSNGKLRDV